MKLTEEFKAYYYNSENQKKLNNIPFKQLPESCQKAIMIQWLESKGLFEYCFEFFWKHRTPSQSFNYVCNQAIEKANTICNDSKLLK